MLLVVVAGFGGLEFVAVPLKSVQLRIVVVVAVAVDVAVVVVVVVVVLGRKKLHYSSESCWKHYFGCFLVP